MESTCFSCNKSLSLGREISRRDECPNCHSDVHVCKNCLHFDPSSYNECRESQAELVREKDRSNFCDYFQLGSRGHSSKSNKEDLKEKAEALFKNWGKK